MPVKRHDMYCAIARSLEAVGDRWTLLVVRELLTGPKRHADLLTGLPGIATNVLADRLRVLQDVGAVTRRTQGPPVPAALYQLTDRGRALQPVLLALADWGLPLLGEPRAHDAFRPSWLVLALQTRFDPGQVPDGQVRVQLRVGGEDVHVTVTPDGVHTEQGEHPAELVLTADPDVFLAWGTQRISDAEALLAGLHVTGGAAGLRRLRALFPLPTGAGTGTG